MFLPRPDVSRRILGWTLAVATWLVAVGSSQAAGLKISGTVKDESGSVVAGVTVALTPVDGSGQPTGGIVTRVPSNKKGRFAFGFAKPGSYVVSVEDDALQIVAATVRMRNGERKPVYGPDGLIEDLTAPVNPANPVVALGIPPDAFYVTVDLTVGQPEAAAAGSSSAAIEKQIIGSGLGDEVEGVLAKLDARQYGPALEGIDALILGNPELAPLFYLKGFTLLKLDRIADAEQALREALRLDPEIAGASGLLGQILGEEGRYDEAVPMLRSELERTEDESSRAALLLGLGQALLETGKAEEAVAVLEEARQLNPDDPATRVQLVDAYLRSGRNDAAEDLLAEELDPEAGAVLHYNLAANLLRNKMWEKGIEHMRRALALNPALADAHKYIAEALLELGRTAEAIAEYESYVEASPNASDADETRRLIEVLKTSMEAQ